MFFFTILQNVNKARAGCNINFLVSKGTKHKQISDCLRDAQSKRRILKAEVDLVNQKRDTRITEINTLQLQFEVKESPFGI